MAQTMDALQSRRKAHRIRFDKAFDTASATLAAGNSTPAQLGVQIKVLQRNLTTLENMDTEIKALITDDTDMEVEITIAEDYQDKFVDLIEQIVDTKRTMEVQMNSASDTSFSHAQPGPTHQIVARVPKLELPKFSGDPLQWTSFWDFYDSSIHSNPRLPDVDKFNYLRSFVEGVAKDSIAGIAVTSANYSVAINLIQERFGQKQAIVSGHVEALVNLAKVSDDTTSLRTLYDVSEIHIRGLESQGITAVQNGAVLTPILLTKLPNKIRLVITRKNGAPIGDLDTLRDLLKTEIEARELSMFTSNQQAPRQRRDIQAEFSASAMVNNTFSDVFCGFCRQSGHRPTECRQFSTLQQRQAKVNRDNLCGNCLKPGHHAPDCRSAFSCRSCNSRHHTALCNQAGFRSSNSSNPASANQKRNWSQSQQHQDSNVNVISQDVSEDALTVAATAPPALVSNSSTVLMQTAYAKISNASGGVHIVRLLFDTASDRSYMTQSLPTKLSFPATSSQALAIAPYGQPRSGAKRYVVAIVKLVSVDGSSSSYTLSAVIVPTITCPIYRASVTSSSAVLKNLKMADPPNQRTTVDEHRHFGWIGLLLAIGPG